MFGRRTAVGEQWRNRRSQLTPQRGLNMGEPTMRHLAKTLSVGLGVGIAAMVLAPAAIAAPGLQLDKQDLTAKQCGDHAKQVVNVHFTLQNDPDSGFAGNNWATDTIDRQLRIFQVADGYCAVVTDHGTFVTLAGTSPSGASDVTAGVTGELEGGYVTSIASGPLDGSQPTHGDLGTFDALSSHPSFATYDSNWDVNLAQWGWIYHAGKHGTWLNQDDVAAADSGDITG